jgi:uncharacterized membrane protein
MEDFFMLSCTKFYSLFCSLALWGLSLNNYAAPSSDSVTLYTPYTRISVPPGESVDYAIDVINNSKELQRVDLQLTGIPKSWTYSLKSGGWTVSQLSILPGERKSLSLKVDVPLQVNKGNYRFTIIAVGHTVLPITINVSEKGTFKTEFTTDQANMQGHSGSTFTFNGELRNRTANRQLYALMASAAPGWEVVFKVSYNKVTSVEIDPNNATKITIEIKPPASIMAGTYEIPIKAATNATSAELRLQIVITGTYNMELTTRTGLLSSKITAGDSKRVEFIVMNTGTTILQNINLTATGPSNWDVDIEPDKVDQLAVGEVAQVNITIKAGKKAIPGDYLVNFEAKTQETMAKASYRASVVTSLLWGWIGILIILIALGSIYYLFRKYGRR